MITALVIVLAVLVSLVVVMTLIIVLTSSVGYEDEDGFHYGRESDE